MILRMDETGEFFVYIGDDEPPGVEVVELPEIPPPVWDERRIDPAACVAATKALCG